VAEFVANMNPLGVLTARDVMLAGVANSKTLGPRQDPETPVRELMEMLPAARAGSWWKRVARSSAP
jgi:glycine betaine/proline transport system ATP-binding protein